MAAIAYAASEALADRTVTSVTTIRSDGVEVAIDNRGPSQADIAVAKTAAPPSVPEPGGAVTLTVVVTNTGAESVTLTSLLDVPYGDLADPSNAEIWNSTCMTGALIAPAGDAYTCSFQAGVAGNAGTLHTDTVTATVRDDGGGEASADAGAVVHVTDVEPTVEAAKAADPPSVPEPGGAVTFTVVVTNTGVESVTLTSLLDAPYGDLADPSNAEIWNSTCVTGGLIAPAGDAYTCSFQAGVAGNAGTLHTDTVTATVRDDEGNAASADAGAVVHVTDVEPTVDVAKAADPPSVPEPGGVVTFTVVVTNTGAESVTLTSLLDAPYGDLADPSNAKILDSTCVTGRSIAPNGGAYTCSFQAGVAGNAGTVHTDTVTATVRDDEDNAASADASAVVHVTDVEPTIDVAKAADPSSLPEPGGVVTFTVVVTNTGVESVTLTSLLDAPYGDLADPSNAKILDSTCVTGRSIAPNGGAYTCSFQAGVAGNAGTLHTDTVTATVRDDEDNAASADASAVVHVTDVEPTAEVAKAADPPSVPEPGGAVTFTVVVTNTGVESVTLTSLLDVPYGDLADPSNAEIWNSTCVTGGSIAPNGGAYTCSFQAGVAGNAGTLHTDTVTATVRDDEDNAVEAAGGATVAITDVDPSISVTKTADPTVIRAGDRVDFSIRVYNRSVEPVTLINLDDTIFGDLATECGLPVGIAVSEFFECVINRPINADHTNTVTATAEDDEGNEVTDSAGASVDVIGPAIRVVKAASVYTATVGETITYTYAVENAGDATLTDVSASDDRLGAIRLTRATLAPGEITTGTTVYPVDESDLPGPLTNTVVVTGTPPVGDDVTDTDVATVYVQPAIRLVYLPLVLNHHVPPAPDLVVEQIMVTSSDVQVVIKNQGDASVLPEDGFWVDLYVDPHPVPTGVNQTWESLCSEGIVWGVEEPALPLKPGGTITLTVGDDYYSEEYSNFSGSFATGTPIYVQVDSANVETTYGAVLEGHEMVGGPYNNVSGPVFPALAAAGAEPAEAEWPAVSDHPRTPSRHLPPRP